MEYTLKDFEGAYSCIPNVVSDLTSPEGYMLLSKIYAYGCRSFGVALVDNEIPISIRNIEKMTGLGFKKITRATKELEDLNMIKVYGSSRQKRSYLINWDEIHNAHTIMSSLSYDGIVEIRKLCKANKSTKALSQLNPESVSRIIEDYQYDWSKIVFQNEENAKKKTNLIADERPISLKDKTAQKKTIKDGTVFLSDENAKEKTNYADENKEFVFQNEENAKKKTIYNMIGVQYGHKFTEEEDGSLTLNVNVSESECILAKHVKISKINLFSLDQICFPEPSICFPVCNEASKSDKKENTVNIIKIKENVLGERSEPSNIGGEKQKTSEIEKEIEDDDFYEGKDYFEDLEKEENLERQEKDNEEEGKPFYEGLEIPDKFQDPISESEYYRRDLERIKKEERTLNNPFLNKPYFPEKVMKRITSFEGLQEEGVKSPVKLFYYNFWWGLFDWYQGENEKDIPVDEYGNPLEEEEELNDLSMLRSFIPVEEMFKQIERAWRDTEDNIKAGFIALEGGDVKVDIKELPDINPMFLIDWRVTKDLNKKNVFVISLEGFRNIDAKDATEVKKPKTKEEVKAFNRTNRQFLAAVVNMEDSQLTPMERAVKDFAGDFLRTDEYYHVEGFMNGRGEQMVCNLLPGYLLKPWALKMSTKLGVTQADFYKTLNQKGGYKDGANLSFMATTFDYQEVKRWNDMNGFQSQINDETLKNAV